MCRAALEESVDGALRSLIAHPERNTPRKQSRETAILRLDTVDTSKNEIVPCGDPVIQKVQAEQKSLHRKVAPLRYRPAHTP
jgi:hypothetical protein